MEQQPKPSPDEMPDQGVIIDGQFVPAQMLSAESVAKRVEHQLAELAAAEDDAAKRRCLQALIQSVRIYGEPALKRLADDGFTREQLESQLAELSQE